MGCRKKFKDIVKGFDLFSQRVGFRFDDESEYETFTGGVCSVIVIICFIAIFTGTTINTFNKVNVSSVITMFEEIDPSHYEVGIDKFIFAIGIVGLDLNEGDRWFDISMQFRSYGPDERNKTYMNLVPCTKKQWTAVNQSFEQVYDRVGFDSWLCPEEGTVLQLQGKFTSEYFKFYRFVVEECNPSFNPSRPCKNSSEIEAYLDEEQSFSFNFYFVNTIINGGSHDYLTYYLEDMNYFPFSTTDGINANIFMATYTITTDESIYPIQDTKNDTGGIVTTLAQIHNYGVRQNKYLKLYLRKSSKDILVERSFRKADDTLSYIGGLFSAIFGVLIIMTLFNEFSYQLQIAKNLYYYESNQPLDSEGFNFLVYLGYLVYNLFQKVGINLNWQKMRKYHRSLEEVRKQMDVRFIMKKILYSQRAAKAVLDEHQQKILHLQEPLTLEEAEEIRSDHLFYQKLQKYYFLNETEERKEQNNTQNTPENKQYSKEQNMLNYNLSNDNLIFNADQERGQDKAIQGKVEGESEYSSEQEQERKVCEQKIKKMKKYVILLENESERDNIVSKRILEKFDKKIKRRFMARRGKKQKLLNVKQLNLDHL